MRPEFRTLRAVANRHSCWLIALLLLGISAEASAMRCGSKLVLRDDPQAKVLRYCGEPAYITQRYIHRSTVFVPRRRTSLDANGRLRSNETAALNHAYPSEVLVEEWTYNFGPQKLMRLVRFENGLVVNVRELGYGYRE